MFVVRMSLKKRRPPERPRNRRRLLEQPALRFGYSAGIEQGACQLRECRFINHLGKLRPVRHERLWCMARENRIKTGRDGKVKARADVRRNVLRSWRPA